MNDRPSAVELVTAVRQFLETELIPTLSDARLRCQTLVAANILAIAERELPSEEHALAEECTALCALLEQSSADLAAVSDLRARAVEWNEQLCRRIRAGAYDAPKQFAQLRSFVRAAVIRKLQVANPR